MKSVFLDTGIFVAFLSERDQWHPQAVALFGTGNPRWMTSLLVVSETYSWFLHRMGEESARKFSALLGQMEGLQILEIPLNHHTRVLKTLDRFRGTKLTYVDASSLGFIEKHKVHQVWSTDHHLSMTGAEILPRS